VSEGPREAGREQSREHAPESARAALARAGRHARAAAAEAILAARALLDAAALAQGGAPAEASPALAQIALWLERLASGVSPDGASDADLTRALAEALDAEIARWEQRAREDADARAVLRAFLGVRELLWELGVRPPPSRSAGETSAPPRPPRSRGRRVQRVPVQG
jgi:hypothetical protein